jgi:hypothetical protein
MARTPVPLPTAIVLLVIASALPAAAEVNFAWTVVGRDYELHHAAYDESASGLAYQLDFGPSSWSFRPEASFTSVGANAFSNDGQREYAAGLAWRMREDDVGLRLSGGAAEVKTFDGNREDRVKGAYLQAAVVWHTGARFNLGLSWRGFQGQDTEVAGRELGVDYRQFGVFLGWRFGD